MYKVCCMYLISLMKGGKAIVLYFNFIRLECSNKFKEVVMAIFAMTVIMVIVVCITIIAILSFFKKK